MKKSVVSGVAGSVRILPLSLAELDKQEKHGKRTDTTSQPRRIKDVPPVETMGLDLCDQYARHIDGAFVPRARTKAMHVLIQFPKDLVNLDDADGLLHHAREFGRGIWGDDAIFADRYDRDEKSSGVVDLFVAPKYIKKTKNDPVGRLAVSMTRHNKALAKKHGRDPDKVWDVGKSLQDELYIYLRDVMGLEDVKRGSPKVFAGDDWKSAEQLRVEELEDEERRLKEHAAELEARAKQLEARETAALAQEEALALKDADQASRQKQLEAEEDATKRNRASVEMETAQATLLLRAADDDEGLNLIIRESGKPEMNEAAMNDKECEAYRSTWSERMMELARFIAKALKVMREKVATAVARERSAKEREAAADIALQAADQRLKEASAAQERVESVKAVAEVFMAAWERIPEEQRLPPIRDAVVKAERVLAPDERLEASSKPGGSPKSAAEAAAYLKGLARGPNVPRGHQNGDLSRLPGKDGASR